MDRRLAVMVCSLIAVGCRQKPADAPAPEPSVVARVGSQQITARDVEAELARQPEFVRGRYAAPEKRREFLDTMIRTQLLLEEAHRIGLEKEPEVKAMMDRLLSQQLVQRELAALTADEQALRGYYEAHQAEYSRPQRVRASIVLFSASKGAPNREQARQEVERELAKLRTVKGEPQAQAFLALVRRRSDHDGSRVQDGDLGPRTLGELEGQHGEAVANGIFALKDPGSISGVLENDIGFVIARLVSRQPAEEKSFEAVRSQIQPRVTAELRGKALDAMVERFKKNTPVTVDDAELARIKIAGSTGSGPSQ